VILEREPRRPISLRVQVFGIPHTVGCSTRGERVPNAYARVVARAPNVKHEVEQRTTDAKIGAEQARNSILMLGGQERAAASKSTCYRLPGFLRTNHPGK